MEYLIFFAGAFILIAVLMRAESNSRRRELARLARELSFTFRFDATDSIFERFYFLNILSFGYHQRALNVMEGEAEGRGIVAFDIKYHNELLAKDRAKLVSVFLIELPLDAPVLEIRPRNFFPTSIFDVVTAEVRLDSLEFDASYQTLSSDSRFAYDTCHSMMMQFLLDNPGMHLFFARDTLACVYEPAVPLLHYEFCLDRMLELADLIPRHLLLELGEEEAFSTEI